MLLWLGLLLLALVMIYSQAGVVEPNAGHDFILLLSAAQAIRGNLSPYDPFVIVHFASLDGVPLYHLLNGGRATQPYVYPPLFAWLVQPFTHLNTVSALWLWRALSACAIFLGTYGLALTWRKESDLFSTRSRRLMIAALVTLAPLSVYGLYWGNPAALVYAALGVAIWALTRNQARFDVIAGVIMTVLLLKPQLALPLGLLAALCFLQGSDAWQRRRRVFAGFVGATVLLLAADLLVTGPQMLLDWPRSILYLEQFSNGQPDMPSLIGLFWVYLSPLPSALYQGLSLVILGACAIIVAVLYMRLRSTWVPAALFGLLTVVWCFGTPYAHANDEILLVPGGFAVLAALSRAWQDGLLRTNVRSRRLITPT